MTHGLGIRNLSYLVNVAPQLSIFDNFNRVSGPLGSTSDGNGTWVTLSGSFEVASNRAISSPANATSGLAVVNNFAANSTVSLNVSTGGGDAMYFRVVDANNWWRVVVDSVTSTSTVPDGYVEYLWWSYRSGHEYYPHASGPATFNGVQCWQTYHGHDQAFGGFGPWPILEIWHTSPSSPPTSGYPSTTHTHSLVLDNCGATVTFSHTHGGVYSYVNQTRFVQSGSTTFSSTTTTMRLQSCVNGTVTTVGSAGGSTTAISVVANDTSIAVRRNNSVTNSISTISSLHENATLHGFGRGTTTNRGTAIDNFSCVPITS